MPREKKLRQALLPGIVEHEGTLIWLPPAEAAPAPEPVGPLEGEPVGPLGVSAAGLDAAYVGAAWQRPKKGTLPVTVTPVQVEGRPHVCWGVESGPAGRRWFLLPLYGPAAFASAHPGVAVSQVPAGGTYAGTLVTVGRGRAARQLVIGPEAEGRTLVEMKGG